MGLADRKKVTKEPLMAPPAPDVWNADNDQAVHYFVRDSWQWVIREVATQEMGDDSRDGCQEVPDVTELPTSKLKAAALQGSTPSTTRRRRAAARKIKGPATLMVEISNPATGEVQLAAHGSSSALDGLEDKDELVRTLQRCRCDHLNLSPPAVLISWDCSREECLNVVGKEMPSLLTEKSKRSTSPKKDGTDSDVNHDKPKFAVLKEPMGSQGQGIYFVQTADEIHKIIDEHRQKAQQDPDFLNNLIAAKGRIPSWVLQAEVLPWMLIKDRRKFHIRTYIVVKEKPPEGPDRPNPEDLFDIFVFKRHEIRLAGVPIEDDDTEGGRDRSSHITNGALTATTERLLLEDVEELVSRGIQEKTEAFVAECFAKHLLPDMARRVSASAAEAAREKNGHSVVQIRKFAVAGLDLMVTADNKIYLLEVNADPSAPSEGMLSERFKEHLKGFLYSLVNLVVGQPAPDFVPAREILQRKK